MDNDKCAGGYFQFIASGIEGGSEKYDDIPMKWMERSIQMMSLVSAGRRQSNGS